MLAADTPPPPTPPPPPLLDPVRSRETTTSATARASNAFLMLPPGAVLSAPLPAASRSVNGARPGTSGPRSLAATPSINLVFGGGGGGGGSGGDCGVGMDGDNETTVSTEFEIVRWRVVVFDGGGGGGGGGSGVAMTRVEGTVPMEFEKTGWRVGKQGEWGGGETCESDGVLSEFHPTSKLVYKRTAITKQTNSNNTVDRMLAINHHDEDGASTYAPQLNATQPTHTWHTCPDRRGGLPTPTSAGGSGTAGLGAGA